jgi:hypothetical protein
MPLPKYCQTLLISARVRSDLQFQQYRPFERANLSTLFAKAAAKVAQAMRSPVFDEHALYPYFLFGGELDDQRKFDVRRLPSSIIDCDIFRSDDVDATKRATRAIFEFAYVDQRKAMVFVCGSKCSEPLEFNHFPATNDAELYAFLFMDLSSNAFAVIGKTLANGS